MILQLSTIFYIIRNNSKSEEYVDWLPNNDLDIRNFNLELNKILFDGNDKSQNYWNLLFKLLAKANYQNVINLLQIHSWKKSNIKEENDMINNIIVI